MQNFETQEQLLQKRLAQAQAMRDQEFTPAQAQMVGGRYIRPDFSQSLIQGLRMYRGMKEAQGAETELKDLQGQKQQAMQGDMSAMLAALRGKPAETVQPLTPNDDEGNVNPPVQMPAQAGSVDKFYEAALKSQFPQFQQMGMQGAITSAQQQAQQAQALRKTDQPTTPTQQATDSGVPQMSPQAGTMQGGEFRAMKTGGPEGMQSVPGYSMAQPQQQPQVDPYDVQQYKSPRFQQMLQQQRLQQLTAVPEYSQTPQYDQQGRAFVLDKQGNMKYLGGDQMPVRKADYNELIQIDPRTGQPIRNELLFNTKRDISRAGAANVSVNTGQKGFDNTLKLRSDFRSEPVYKGFQEVNRC